MLNLIDIQWFFLQTIYDKRKRVFPFCLYAFAFNDSIVFLWFIIKCDKSWLYPWRMFLIIMKSDNSFYKRSMAWNKTWRHLYFRLYLIRFFQSYLFFLICYSCLAHELKSHVYRLISHRKYPIIPSSWKVFVALAFLYLLYYLFNVNEDVAQ